jgi:phospholipase/carboxylesterase
VAIHGLGDTPEDFVEWLRSVPVPARIYAPRGIFPFGSGDGRAWWAPTNGDEAATARALDAAADAIARASSGKVQGNTVCGQPIVLGFSQGAMLTFALAQRASPAWRMAIPIAGRVPPGSRVGARNAVKIRAMHGTTDDRIPLAGGRAAVDGLRARGFDATLRTFNGVAHSIPIEVQREVFRTIEEEARAMGCVR